MVRCRCDCRSSHFFVVVLISGLLHRAGAVRWKDIMLRNILRVVLALQGAMALLIAATAYVRTDQLASQLGFYIVGTLGMASFRADIGSFFAVAGIFMLLASVRGQRDFLIAPMLMTGLALASRAASAVQLGYSPEMMQPMVVEGVTLAVLTASFFVLDRRS